MEINKAKLLDYVQIYANNVSHDIAMSSADAATKKLAESIAEDTCDVLAAIINAIKD